MEIEGRIIQELPMQSGTSKAGNPWKKREWVLETFGNYPRKVKFHVFGDRSDNIGIEVGKDYALSFDIDSREFNGRWYTDISVFQARELTQQGGGMPQNPSYGAPQQPYGQPSFQQNAPAFTQGAAPDFTSSDSSEDLPF